jgi:hypothetical protein
MALPSPRELPVTRATRLVDGTPAIIPEGLACPGRVRPRSGRQLEVGGAEPSREPDVDTAADVVYGLLDEEVFQLFTADCGWDDERFQRWATSLMLQQLVGADVTRP